MPVKKAAVKRKQGSSDKAAPRKISRKSIAAKEPALEAVLEAASPAPEDNRQSGELLTLGMGDVGQLGLGPDTLERRMPALVSGLTDVVQIIAGGMHTVCLTKDGRVFTFGCNDEGALGRITDGDEELESRPGPVELAGRAMQVSAGDSHTAARLEDGRVFAWGAFRDSRGMMGLKSDNRFEIVPQLMDIKGEQAVKIASGVDHLLILTRKGRVYSCGCGEQGQLGRLSLKFADRDSRNGLSKLLTPTQVSSLRFECDNIFTGQYSSYIREKAGGKIFVFGLNNYKQLALENIGSYYHPTQSTGFSGKKWDKICGGQHHTLALDPSGVVYSLGRREYGRLGLGPIQGDAPPELGEPSMVPALSDKKCVDIACGTCVSFAVTADGRVYSWGMGSNGQLGTGDEDDYYEPVEMRGQQLQGRQVFGASGGGQHTVLLATPKPS